MSSNYFCSLYFSAKCFSLFLLPVFFLFTFYYIAITNVNMLCNTLLGGMRVCAFKLIIEYFIRESINSIWHNTELLLFFTSSYFWMDGERGGLKADLGLPREELPNVQGIIEK